MEQIKLGLRIASIVVGIIGYSAIWIYLINNRRNEKSELAWVSWKINFCNCDCACVSLGVVLGEDYIRR